MNFKKTLLVGMLTIIVSVQCSGAAYTQRDKDKMFLEAVQAGNTVKVQELLASKASITATDFIGYTALMSAASNNHMQILKILLSNENVCETIDQDKKSGGKTALHAAAEKNHVEAILALLAAGACVDKTNNDGETALHSAALWGRDKAIRTLLAHGASINATDREGETALYKAMKHFFSGTTKTIYIILDEHYNVLIKRCPVIEILQNDDIEHQVITLPPNDALELIAMQLSPCDLANFRLVCKNFHGGALRIFENIRTLRASQLKATLIRCFQDALNKIKKEFAITIQQENKIKTIKLLETELAHVTGLDVDTLLQGNIICNEELRSKVAQDEKDEILLSAAQAGDATKVQELLASKASITATDSIGYTALMAAADNNHMQILKTLLSNENVCETIDQDRKSDGKTALHAAAEKNHVEVILALLAAGACVDKTNNDGETALHVAAFWGHDKAIRALLAHGASINATDSKGEMALHRATKQFFPKITGTLLDAHYKALSRRCPAIGSITIDSLGTQIATMPPSDALEIIATRLAPYDLANFRLVCKDFHASACHIFENIRKLRAFQLKATLINRIEDVLHKTTNKGARFDFEKKNKQATIELLKSELQKAQGLDIDGLLRGVIICNEELRFNISEMELENAQEYITSPAFAMPEIDLAAMPIFPHPILSFEESVEEKMATLEDKSEVEAMEEVD